MYGYSDGISSVYSSLSWSTRTVSCVDTATRLRVQDHAGRIVVRPAREILRQAYGRRPYRAVLSSEGQMWTAPIQGALETMAQGYQITIGNTTVTVTGSHAFPGVPRQGEDFAVRQVSVPGLERAYWAAALPTTHVVVEDSDPRQVVAGRRTTAQSEYERDHGGRQSGRQAIFLEPGQSLSLARFDGLLGYVPSLRPLAVGDELQHGTVAAIRPVGLIHAVRFWVDHPGWMLTGDGMPIGHRLHELVAAWTDEGEALYESDRLDAGRIKASDRMAPLGAEGGHDALDPSYWVTGYQLALRDGLQAELWRGIGGEDELLGRRLHSIPGDGAAGLAGKIGRLEWSRAEPDAAGRRACLGGCRWDHRRRRAFFQQSPISPSAARHAL